MGLYARLRPTIRTVHRRLVGWGLDGRTTLAAARSVGSAHADRSEYERQRLASSHPDDFTIRSSYPIVDDRLSEAGTASGHYFHQDLLVAREVFRRNPQRHVDVGSAIAGFVAHVASFRDVEVLDVRPVSATVPGITFVQQDVMSLDPSFDGCTDSLSCLHALEHFGLGRYGDPVDYDGWRKGLAGLCRMLTPGGTLYLSVPTGLDQRVEFNAHRVFSLPFLRDALEGDFRIERLAFVTDAGDLIHDVDPYGDDAQRSLDSEYGCSIWVLTKK